MQFFCIFINTFLSLRLALVSYVVFSVSNGFIKNYKNVDKMITFLAEGFYTRLHLQTLFHPIFNHFQ
jgi:hypothetical protein